MSQRSRSSAPLLNAPPALGILSDRQIRELALDKGMIVPFVENQKNDGAISYGLSSYGYDVRAGREFKVFTNVHCTEVDPKNFDSASFVDKIVDDYVTIPPNSFALAQTIETFDMPREVMAICVGKSTYARCGIIVNVTPIESGWRGMITLEFSNTTPLPARIYANEGAAQLVFFAGSDVCEISYADRKGKYQDQKNITLPRIKRRK